MPNMKGSTKSGSSGRSNMSLDLVLKFATFCSSLYHLSLTTTDLHDEETKFRNILFTRNIWLPELCVSLLLLLTALFSRVSAIFLSRSIVYIDTFVIILLEKLVMIGYNLHLIIFHVSLIYKTESALLLLPLLIFLLSAVECTVTVLYLDTVFFDIVDWQKSLLCSVRLPSFLLTHHLLCVFVFLQFDTIGIQFTHSLYHNLDL